MLEERLLLVDPLTILCKILNEFRVHSDRREVWDFEEKWEHVFVRKELRCCKRDNRGGNERLLLDMPRYVTCIAFDIVTTVP